MTSLALRRAILVSLAGHLALFGIFVFSFGDKFPQRGVSSASFLGYMFTGIELQRPVTLNGAAGRNVPPTVSSVHRSAGRLARQGLAYVPAESYKPPVSLPLGAPKGFITQVGVKEPDYLTKKRSQTIMFYPALPYHVSLYFKDRQSVHIELAFNILSSGKGSSVMVKRRVSSGNLEADLLSMRYITRYLLTQQELFGPQDWQVVRIDLSTSR